MWRGLPLVCTISLWVLAVAVSIDQGPIGSISALATQTRTFSETVKLSYFEAVNCTLSFNEEVAAFSPAHITKADTTVISNFIEVSKQLYLFQVSSVTNDNVTLSVAKGAVRTLGGGIYNNESTAIFSFAFYAFPPSVTLLLDGFEAQSTRKERNIAYLLFNSTTQYDEDTSWFNASFVTISPFILIKEFQQVSDTMYRFKFTIPLNTSYPDVECLAAAAAPSTDEHAVFACDKCARPQMCTSLTTYPPKGVKYMEFPLSVMLQPVPELGLQSMKLPMVYDTLWGYVQMDAPQYAKEPFYVTITWSEPLSDLVAVLPTFDVSGPPVDQEILKRNLTILSPRSFRLLVAPKRTGIVKISIHGTAASIDLAGNANDFYRIPDSRTSDARTVIFSDGPPLPGSIAFKYDRPRLTGEYPRIQSGAAFQPPVPASLTVSWAGFLTATHYDTWVQWGQNLSTSEVLGLNSTQYTFEEFPAMLSVEYQVYIRAFNYWGESITVARTFLHPKFDIIADGTYSLMALPEMLSPSEQPVSFNALIPKEGFLSINLMKVLQFISMDRSAGDQDPCWENSRTRKCTLLNFHIEVPNAEFVVFRHPLRLQFIFGQQGWTDLHFRPRLRYWETHDDEWRDVSSTCPTEQVHDRWNELHRIYEISVCHLSQFSVFADFEPPALTTAAPAPPRPESYGEATFFFVLGGVVLGGALMCCVCYLGCSRNGPMSWRRPLAYKDMGIKPVTDRLPSRRLGSPGFESLAMPDAEPGQNDGLLALPPIGAPGQGGDDQAVAESTDVPVPQAEALASMPPAYSTMWAVEAAAGAETKAASDESTGAAADDGTALAEAELEPLVDVSGASPTEALPPGAPGPGGNDRAVAEPAELPSSAPQAAAVPSVPPAYSTMWAVEPGASVQSKAAPASDVVSDDDAAHDGVALADAEAAPLGGGGSVFGVVPGEVNADPSFVGAPAETVAVQAHGIRPSKQSKDKTKQRKGTGA